MGRTNRRGPETPGDVSRGARPAGCRTADSRARLPRTRDARGGRATRGGPHEANGGAEASGGRDCREAQRTRCRSRGPDATVPSEGDGAPRRGAVPRDEGARTRRTGDANRVDGGSASTGRSADPAGADGRPSNEPTGRRPPTGTKSLEGTIRGGGGPRTLRGRCDSPVPRREGRGAEGRARPDRAGLQHAPRDPRVEGEGAGGEGEGALRSRS